MTPTDAPTLHPKNLQAQEKLMFQIVRMTNSFVRMMRLKLEENMHKGSWDECTYDYLRSRIDEEIKEFDEAISDGRYLDAMEEAGDVGNFFAMINDNIEFNRFDNYTRIHSSTPDADARQPRKCYDVNVCAFCTDVSCRCNGCISQTKAQEQIENVIRELEALKATAFNEAHKTAPGSGHFAESTFMRACGKEEAFGEAIALLKDGVGRK